MWANAVWRYVATSTVALVVLLVLLLSALTRCASSSPTTPLPPPRDDAPARDASFPSPRELGRDARRAFDVLIQAGRDFWLGFTDQASGLVRDRPTRTR